MELLKILIAEDDKIACMLYDRALNNDVFEKRFAGNGEEVLELYQSWRPQIMLLDIMMPFQSGYAVLKTIRQEENDQSTAIIMASSLSRADDIKACLQLGIQGYLVKPLDFKEVQAKILSYFEQHTQSGCGEAGAKESE